MASELNNAPCGCCEPEERHEVRHNDPGLPAINYRIGTYGTFFRRMLRRLPRVFFETEEPDPVDPTTTVTYRKYPLQRLKTRATDDPAIALCDAWAVTADVLTFYQERIANEHYLRTATERRSILELARTIGYELSPGVAASAYLAFTMEDAPGAPPVSTLPEGTRVQSVPSPGDMPQTFETSTALAARTEWNALRPRLLRPQELAIHGDELFLLGLSTAIPESVATRFEADELDELYAVDASVDLTGVVAPVYGVKVGTVFMQGTSLNLKSGEAILFAGRNRNGSFKTTAKIIREVEDETERARTRLVIEEEAPKLTFQPAVLNLAAVSAAVTAFSGTMVKQIVQMQSWTEKNLSAMISIKGWHPMQIKAQLAIPPPPPAEEGVFKFRAKTGSFGHNAPRWDSLPLNQRFPAHNESEGVPYPDTWDTSVNGPVIGNRSNDTTYLAEHSVHFFAERNITEVPPGSWILLENSAGFRAYRVAMTKDVSLADYALSAKATGFNVTDDSGGGPSELDNYRMRATTIHASSERVLLAPLPIEDDFEEPGEDNEWHGVDRIMLDRLVLGMEVGKVVIVSGNRVDAPAVEESEAATLKEIRHEGGFTILLFAKRLKFRYIRDSVHIYANVVEATHGETVREVLGSGDPTRPNQQFELKKPPLTYTRAQTPSGGESTLEVRVQGIRWDEASSLFRHDEDDAVYVVRHSDDGKAVITFGDGKHGRRLPSGQENVRARYRSGIGVEGEVDAETLTLLQTRPAGIREVTNPLPASGAASPATRDAARHQAPMTVKTLDRIVSLQDFEDFAASYGGVGKAHGAVFWNGMHRTVLLTVAPESGAPLAEDAPLLNGLRAAMDAVRDPGQQLIIERHRLELFNVDADLRVKAEFDEDDVLEAAEESLRSAFSFQRRQFGQPVSASEVIAQLQRVRGVEAVHLQKLYVVSDTVTPTREESLPAVPAHLEDGETVRAQLLLINPAGITLSGIGL